MPASQTVPTVTQLAANAYRTRYGADPQIVVRAPGRVNLIGEHTDYNGGFVLPCAVQRQVAVAIGTGGSSLFSVDYDEERPAIGKDGSWADYPRGVVWALTEAGYALEPFRATFAGDVPQGAGLSSSAAIEAATALALDALFQLGISQRSLAALCQRAENAFIGVASGIMDQYASLLARSGAALLIDCRSLEAESVPLDLERAGLTLLVCDTRVRRGLGATGYNERRATCERAARDLGVGQLRDATMADLAKLSGVELKRARHVISENERVLAAVAALRAEEFRRFGQLMYASHCSLRDDFEVSTTELDVFVEQAEQASALGARLTSAGFGGSAIALVDRQAAGVLPDAVRSRFADLGLGEPAFYTFQPAAGAAVVS